MSTLRPFPLSYFQHCDYCYMEMMDFEADLIRDIANYDIYGQDGVYYMFFIEAFSKRI